MGSCPFDLELSMRRQADIFRWRRLRLVLFLFLLQPLACGERKEPIGIITTTNYCQGTTTASDTIVKPGDIALSHDIEKKYRLKFGDLIYPEGEEEPYTFTDRMPGQWSRRADLYSRSCKTAEEYGVKKRMVWLVRKK